MSKNPNPNICVKCQKRIDLIRQDYKNETWLEEVVNEIERGCIETYRGGFQEHATLDSVNGEECSCGEYKTTVNFTSFRKTDNGSESYMIEKQLFHSCNNNHTERERERANSVCYL